MSSLRCRRDAARQSPVRRQALDGAAVRARPVPSPPAELGGQPTAARRGAGRDGVRGGSGAAARAPGGAGRPAHSRPAPPGGARRAARSSHIPAGRRSQAAAGRRGPPGSRRRTNFAKFRRDTGRSACRAAPPSPAAARSLWVFLAVDSEGRRGGRERRGAEGGGGGGGGGEGGTHLIKILGGPRPAGRRPGCRAGGGGSRPARPPPPLAPSARPQATRAPRVPPRRAPPYMPARGLRAAGGAGGGAPVGRGGAEGHHAPSAGPAARGGSGGAHAECFRLCGVFPARGQRCRRGEAATLERIPGCGQRTLPQKNPRVFAWPLGMPLHGTPSPSCPTVFFTSCQSG